MIFALKNCIRSYDFSHPNVIFNHVKRQRIQAKERQVDNEKYAFRCFLLRLGFIGDDYKEDRRILLKNLEGSSAFKTGKAGE